MMHFFYENPDKCNEKALYRPYLDYDTDLFKGLLELYPSPFCTFQIEKQAVAVTITGKKH